MPVAFRLEPTEAERRLKGGAFGLRNYEIAPPFLKCHLENYEPVREYQIFNKTNLQQSMLYCISIANRPSSIFAKRHLI